MKGWKDFGYIMQNVKSHNKAKLTVGGKFMKSTGVLQHSGLTGYTFYYFFVFLISLESKLFENIYNKKRCVHSEHMEKDYH